MATRILYLITSTNTGGTEKALLELIKRIDHDSWAVHVCSVKKPGRFSRALTDSSVRFFSLEMSESGRLSATLNFLPSLIKLVHIIRQVNPEIIHCFLFRANILGRLAGRIARTPIIISSIRVMEKDKPLKHLIDRLTASMVDKYMAVSESCRRFTIEQLGISPDKIITVYNGIDCREEETSDIKTPSDNTDDVKKIALVGRFDRQKGHDVLLRALKIIMDRNTDLNLNTFFFGEGPDEEKIKAAINRMGLSGKVFFRGVIEDIRGTIAGMDLLVLPSLWEGLPNVLLEAMAEAKPVVASDIEGIDEIVVDGTTGILFEPGNPEAFAEAIMRLLCNQDLAEKMGRTGRAKAVKKFSIENTVAETLTVYQKLMKGMNCRSTGNAETGSSA